jgi:hypothetical protein
VTLSTTWSGLLALALVALAGGCAHENFIPGTTVDRTSDNEEIIRTVEKYRQRLLEKNVDGLLVLASPNYFEDGGTQKADDDYGFEGLRTRLGPLLERVRSIVRYDIQYKKITVSNNRAEVFVFVNGSFELASEMGDRYQRVNDRHKFVLERKGDTGWKFLSGM